MKRVTDPKAILGQGVPFYRPWTGGMSRYNTRNPSLIPARAPIPAPIPAPVVAPAPVPVAPPLRIVTVHHNPPPFFGANPPRNVRNYSIHGPSDEIDAAVGIKAGSEASRHYGLMCPKNKVHVSLTKDRRSHSADEKALIPFESRMPINNGTIQPVQLVDNVRPLDDNQVEAVMRATPRPENVAYFKQPGVRDAFYRGINRTRTNVSENKVRTFVKDDLKAPLFEDSVFDGDDTTSVLEELKKERELRNKRPKGDDDKDDDKEDKNN
jgi:hypothetical protein